jgi:HEPN domain-containing protein
LCFDTQQAAEKAIKAVLIYHGVRFPYIHDLAELLTILKKTGEVIPETVYMVAKITRYAVVARFPGVVEPVSHQEYSEAVLLAENVLAWA